MVLKSLYQPMILRVLATMRPPRIGVDPACIEAFMRSEHPTLDNLDASQFRASVRRSLAAHDAITPAERVAITASFGLGPETPRTATLITGRNLGDDATEDDFDAWVTYVTERIGARTGLDVTVKPCGVRDVQDTAVFADSDEDRTMVKGAAQDIWNEFCADSSAWPDEGAAVSEHVTREDP